MNEWQIYRKLLNNIKDATNGNVKTFGTQLALTKRILKRIIDKKIGVFEIASSKGITFIVSGYPLPEKNNVIPITRLKDEPRAKDGSDEHGGTNAQ